MAMVKTIFRLHFRKTCFIWYDLYMSHVITMGMYQLGYVSACLYISMAVYQHSDMLAQSDILAWLYISTVIY